MCRQGFVQAERLASVSRGAGPTRSASRALWLRARLPAVAHPSVSAAALAGVTLLAVALRVPFLAFGVGPDEGGYAYVAEEWARGGHLYRTLWVDRPQGLLVAYRLLLALADEAWAVRLGAVLAGAVIALLLGLIGSLLVSRSTGISAALIYAVVGVGPNTEGYTFNGELAAALPATAAVAAALAGRRRRGWLLVAGVLGGVAVTMKQSGFDGLAVALAVALGSANGGVRRRLASLALVLLGAALPLAAAALDGLQDGWSGYWSALVGYHLQGGNPLVGLIVRIAHFLSTLDAAARDLLPLALLAAAGVWVCRAEQRRFAVPVVWLAAALLGFNAGGLYWRHYYIQLVPPLALLGAIAATRPRRIEARLLLVAAAVLPVTASLAKLALMPPAQRERAACCARGFENDQRIARYIRGHSRPNQTIYALDSRADLYFLADRDAADKYLWSHPLHAIRPAVPGLVRILASERRPKFVIVYEHPDDVDPSHRLRRVLKRWYRVAWWAPVTLTPVLVAKHEPASTATPPGPHGDDNASGARARAR